MYVFAVLLVLLKVQRPSQLADIVIIRTNARKQRIGAYPSAAPSARAATIMLC